MRMWLTLRPKEQITFAVLYLACLFIGLSAGLIFGLAVVDEILLVGITGYFLYRLLKSYSNREQWSLVAIEIVPLGFLWIIFGLGAIIAMLRLPGTAYYSIDYKDWTVLLMSAYVFIGGVFYSLTIRVVRPYISINGKLLPALFLNILLVCLLLLDWFVRLRQVQAGIYFTWFEQMTQLSVSFRRSNPLFIFHDTVQYVTLALLVYKSLRSPSQWILRSLLILQVILILLSGDRRDVIFTAAVVYASYSFTSGKRIDWRLVGTAGIFGLFFIGFVSPVMQQARLLMRYDIGSLLAYPLSIPVRYLTFYLPRGFYQAYFAQQPQGIAIIIETVGRFGSSMSYAASIYQSLIDGRAALNSAGFWEALSLVVPRILYPQKPVIDSDAIVFSHFGIGYTGLDANGTYVADIFSYFHLSGIIGLVVIGGITIGLLAAHLTRSYGPIGTVILIGFFPNLIFLGDSFGSYLVDLRNMIIFAGLIKVIFIVSRVLSGRMQRYGSFAQIGDARKG